MQQNNNANVVRRAKVKASIKTTRSQAAGTGTKKLANSKPIATALGDIKNRNSIKGTSSSPSLKKGKQVQHVKTTASDVTKNSNASQKVGAQKISKGGQSYAKDSFLTSQLNNGAMRTPGKSVQPTVAKQMTKNGATVVAKRATVRKTQ